MLHGDIEAVRAEPGPRHAVAVIPLAGADVQGAADPRPYDAVLCDVDGVLRHWPPADALDRAHGLPPGTLLGAAFAPARLHPAVTGAVSDAQWRSAVAGDLAAAFGPERAQAVVTAWSEQLPAVDREVAALLTAARAYLRVALVSNGTTRLEEDLARQGLDGVADTVVNTARIGAAKPDPRVYRIAAERVGAAPERCLFVDDTAGHVEAARAAGMTALHFRGADGLRAALGLPATAAG